MRQIGTLPNEKLGRQLIDYLLTEGIEAKAESDSGGSYAIWINHEDQVESAKEVFLHFEASPEDARYQGRAARAQELRMQDTQQRKRARKNYRPGHEVWRSGGNGTRKIPLTFTLIAICVGVALWTDLGENGPASDMLSYVSRKHLSDPDWVHSNPTDANRDIRAGEVWRVITPNFIHLGLIHLLFNMMWVHTLGGQIESVKGWRKLLMMVALFGIASSLCQVYIARYPFFGGMSGVVYGLFGYVWMKSRYDPGDGIRISQQNVQLMVIWFFICFIPGFAVANGGHAGGLIAGVILGYASAHLGKK